MSTIKFRYQIFALLNIRRYMEPKTNGFAQSNTQNITETNVQAHAVPGNTLQKTK